VTYSGLILPSFISFLLVFCRLNPIFVGFFVGIFVAGVFTCGATNSSGHA